MRGLAAAAVLSALAAAPAAADVIVLQNGVRLSGLVQAGTEEELTVQVSEDGFIVLGAAEVLRVERRGPAENDRLRASWASLAARAKELERREREEERLARERREKRLDLEAAAPRPQPPAPPPVTVQVVVYQQTVWAQPVVVRPLGFERRRARLGRSAPLRETIPAMTSSGLLPPPWSIPRDIPLILGPSLAAGS